MSVTGGTIARLLLMRADDGTDLPVDIPRGPAREAAERELSKPMYHQNDPNLLQRGLDRFWEWVDGIFNSAAGATPGGAVGLVTIVLIVIALTVALWWRLGTPRRSPATGSALFNEGPRSAAQHRATAEEHAAAGHFNQAVQERMRAIVRALEERALLDPRPGRTADEAAAEAGRPLPDHAEALRDAARTFDDIAYGGRAADQQAYLRFKELDNQLELTKPQLSTVTPGAAG
ncbi:DUF4129 domain-containing protein [Streptomyces sp. NPDC127084]|uniref:DUF4129 domain-containing protein n=1 Tax=Streptomyces sp. NPDC127084 TaxID=3347133 RepID=UPI0036562375